MVVQVALRGVGTVLLGQYRRDEFLGGGFPVGAGQSNHRDIPGAAVMSGQILQRSQHVFHHEEPLVYCHRRIIHDRVGSSAFQGIFGKSVAVKFLPFERKKQAARFNFPGICTDNGVF